MQDIRIYKSELRRRMKEARRDMPPQQKMAKDEQICRRVTELSAYKRCHTLLCYMSTPIEVDTCRLISKALEDGKRVALPRCVENTREMEFFLINGFEDVEPASFGVLEPIRERCEKLTDFTSSICVVPALACDRYGYRLGYGKGYYDRFLSRYRQFKLAIVYHEGLLERLEHGRYDRPVDLVVTDRFTLGIIGHRARPHRIGKKRPGKTGRPGTKTNH